MVRGEFQLQEDDTAGGVVFPELRRPQAAKAGDEMIELDGEWGVGVADGQRDEPEALGLSVLEDVLGDAETLLASTGDAKSVVAMG